MSKQTLSILQALLVSAQPRRLVRIVAIPQRIPTVQEGCIRDVENAYSQEGGLAVLYGNIAKDGCIVKTAGVEEEIWKFTGRARIFESQDDAVDGILNDKVEAGDVVIIRYEGPKGGPGMQEMLYPTSYLKSKGLGKACALITDGRFSGGTSVCQLVTVRRKLPVVAVLVWWKKAIPLLLISRLALLMWILAMQKWPLDVRKWTHQTNPWQPIDRERPVSNALKVFAKLATSADKGAVRDVSALDN